MAGFITVLAKAIREDVGATKTTAKAKGKTTAKAKTGAAERRR